jgi:excisionase family DNA binding protein
MADDRVPLFVRLPREQALALDRLVDSTGQRKQHLVSELLADQLTVGRAEVVRDFRPDPGAEQVLTLEEAAELLRVPAEAVLAGAERGELPGRMLAGEWRFARSALLAWLSGGDSGQRTQGPAGEADRQ